ncbi:MAG TPA: MarR family winged helix-turn-helix transcriptional regulator [Candidatus Sulfotelmatobacter sp.]|nr:MarR family winged helix-turn-helix transcriptional regulator [Candidatus Sulfotelmatobacter sp.]
MNAQTVNHPTNGVCACSALRRAARSATQLYDLVLQPTGLKATQFIALKNIAEAGELEQWRFAKQQALAVETLSRRLAVLRKKGLVSARVGGNHGERIYSLTELGKETLAKALPYWERAQKRLTATLGEAQLRLLLRVCDLTVAAAHEAERMRATNAGALHPVEGSVPENGNGRLEQGPIVF